MTYVGFWRRVLASVIDSILVMGVAFLLLKIAGLSLADFANLDSNHASGGWIDKEILLSLFVAFLNYTYVSAMECSVLQATIGKIIIMAQVTDTKGKRLSIGRAFARNFFKLFSSLILNIGFFMVGFTEKKRGLHDFMAGTLVIDAGSGMSETELKPQSWTDQIKPQDQ